MKHSADLLERYKRTMLKKYNHVVDYEQAQIELESLAELFQIFSDIEAKKKV